MRDSAPCTACPAARADRIRPSTQLSQGSNWAIVSDWYEPVASLGSIVPVLDFPELTPNPSTLDAEGLGELPRLPYGLLGILEYHSTRKVIR